MKATVVVSSFGEIRLSVHGDAEAERAILDILKHCEMSGISWGGAQSPASSETVITFNFVYQADKPVIAQQGQQQHDSSNVV